MALDFDPYAILGLPIDATDAQIAQARRRLSREYHPDVNGAPGAAERFDKVQRAFELLSDPAARAEYDRTGSHPGAARPARGPGRPPVLPIWAGAALGLFILGTVCVLLVTHVSLSSTSAANSGGRAVSTASAAPPRPVRVPQVHAVLDVQPVFRANTRLAGDMAAERKAGIAALPVPHGFEMLLPMRFPPGAGAPDCVDIQAPEANSADAHQGAAGGVFTEYPVGTIRTPAGGGITAELVYPAVLPGTYVFDPRCMPDSGGTNYSAVTLGSVTTRSLGVEDGSPAALHGNALVVFAAHTSGAVTAVSYGAIGAEDGDSLTPPANGSCVGNGATGGQTRYWQPARALVSQRVTSKREWFETGTMVFRETRAGSPRGAFYYDCAAASGTPGIQVPRG